MEKVAWILAYIEDCRNVYGRRPLYTSTQWCMSLNVCLPDGSQVHTFLELVRFQAKVTLQRSCQLTM